MKAVHFKNWIKIYFHIPLLTHEEWHKIKNVLNHLQILVTKLGGSTNFYKNNFKSYKMTQTLVWPPTLTEYTNTWDISKSIKLSWDDLIQNLVEPQTDTNRFFNIYNFDILSISPNFTFINKLIGGPTNSVLMLLLKTIWIFMFRAPTIFWQQNIATWYDKIYV